ncbi:hypothetical protein QQ045_033360 [Rhodiola kirilowii]
MADQPVPRADGERVNVDIAAALTALTTKMAAMSTQLTEVVNKSRRGDRRGELNRVPQVKSDIPLFYGILGGQEFLNWQVEVDEFFEVMGVPKNIQKPVAPDAVEDIKTEATAEPMEEEKPVEVPEADEVVKTETTEMEKPVAVPTDDEVVETETIKEEQPVTAPIVEEILKTDVLVEEVEQPVQDLIIELTKAKKLLEFAPVMHPQAEGNQLTIAIAAEQGSTKLKIGNDVIQLHKHVPFKVNDVLYLEENSGSSSFEVEETDVGAFKAPN